jgi:hypothetical protein
LGDGITMEIEENFVVLNNCAADPHIDSLKNIKMEFLSPKTTSLVQLMDMVIIKNLMILYNAKLVNYIHP